MEKELQLRSQSQCELCGVSENLSVFIVPPKSGDVADECAFVCATCKTQIENPDQVDPNHWRCLNESMWSEVPAVQVLVWRMLHRLGNEGWSQELIDMMYLSDEVLSWANDGGAEKVVHLDSYGVVLEAGDTVTLIQDLDVKGANFTAKRGTAVRRISLVADNPEQIEGKVNDQRIVILTKYVKKVK